MSAFGGKADVTHYTIKGLLLAINGLRRSLSFAGALSPFKGEDIRNTHLRQCHTYRRVHHSISVSRNTFRASMKSEEAVNSASMISFVSILRNDCQKV